MFLFNRSGHYSLLCFYLSRRFRLSDLTTVFRCFCLVDMIIILSFGLLGFFIQQAVRFFFYSLELFFSLVMKEWVKQAIHIVIFFLCCCIFWFMLVFVVCYLYSASLPLLFLALTLAAFYWNLWVVTLSIRLIQFLVRFDSVSSLRLLSSEYSVSNPV